MAKKNSFEKNWEFMHYDVLLKIFTLLNQLDLICGISRVCHSWKFVCSDPTLWDTLNLRVFGDLFNVPVQLIAWLDSSSHRRLMIILKNAFALSKGSIRTMIFSFYVCISDHHLVYTATSCPNVRRVVLPAWHQISPNGFNMAFQQWKELESLIIPRIPNPQQIMMSIGEHCHFFKELKIMSPSDLEFATSVASYVPGLKVMSLRCSIIFKDALEHILDNLKYLEVLNISHCLLISIFIPGPVIVYWQLDAAILEKASRLREFYVCERDSCVLCQRPFLVQGNLTWHDYEERLVRTDEVRSFAH